jgi:peptidoglycan hydrolase-like protein with peptidoglycan-binding domain
MGFAVSTSGAGSKGKETNYFGTKTFLALKKYQKAQGIISTGYFGPITRAQVNKSMSAK